MDVQQSVGPNPPACWGPFDHKSPSALAMDRKKGNARDWKVISKLFYEVK
jgi:hypothetical protein